MGKLDSPAQIPGSHRRLAIRHACYTAAHGSGLERETAFSRWTSTPARRESLCRRLEALDSSQDLPSSAPSISLQWGLIPYWCKASLSRRQ